MDFTSDDILLAARIKALGHPARLTIVRALLAAQNGRCFCGDIVKTLPLAQSTVSQHLKVLREAGLIQGEIEGPRSCYWLDRSVLASIAEAVTGFDKPGGECCRAAESA